MVGVREHSELAQIMWVGLGRVPFFCHGLCPADINPYEQSEPVQSPALRRWGSMCILLWCQWWCQLRQGSGDGGEMAVHRPQLCQDVTHICRRLLRAWGHGMGSWWRGSTPWSPFSYRCYLGTSIMGRAWGCAAAVLHAFQGACSCGWLVFLLPSNGGECCRGKEGQPVDEVGGTARWDYWQKKSRVQGWSRSGWCRKRREARVNCSSRSWCRWCNRRQFGM